MVTLDDVYADMPALEPIPTSTLPHPLDDPNGVDAAALEQDEVPLRCTKMILLQGGVAVTVERVDFAGLPLWSEFPKEAVVSLSFEGRGMEGVTAAVGDHCLPRLVRLVLRNCLSLPMDGYRRHDIVAALPELRRLEVYNCRESPVFFNGAVPFLHLFAGVASIEALAVMDRGASAVAHLPDSTRVLFNVAAAPVFPELRFLAARPLQGELPISFVKQLEGVALPHEEMFRQVVSRNDCPQAAWPRLRKIALLQRSRHFDADDAVSGRRWVERIVEVVQRDLRNAPPSMSDPHRRLDTYSMRSPPRNALSLSLPIPNRFFRLGSIWAPELTVHVQRQHALEKEWNGVLLQSYGYRDNGMLNIFFADHELNLRRFG